ncbi:MAG: hypothetical protein COB36_10810 [Alphaproteobacteria bacterium]|nr:MAG: hypothetical protein COB36_10810 [Alphaproteobacteria bacterium]
MSLAEMIIRSATEDQLKDLLVEMEKEASKYLSAIEWALGENGEFPSQPDRDEYHGPEKKYWWRSELRTRAGLDSNPE